MLEIFDVTQTDPALLVTDNMGIQYSMEDQASLLEKVSTSISVLIGYFPQVLLNDSVARLRHSSGPSGLPGSKSRRSSVQGGLGGPPPLRSRHASSPQTGSGSSAYCRSISTPAPQTMATFLVGDDSDEEEDSHNADTKRGYFSDPECEEVMDKTK